MEFWTVLALWIMGRIPSSSVNYKKHSVPENQHCTEKITATQVLSIAIKIFEAPNSSRTVNAQSPWATFWISK
ncbi:unnamed protein product, partial [Nesidiocoris tenuis]